MYPNNLKFLTIFSNPDNPSNHECPRTFYDILDPSTGCLKKKFTLGIQFDFSIFSAYFNDTPQTNTTFKKLTKF